MKSKTSRRPSFLAKPGGRGRRREVLLPPPKRSLALEQFAGMEVRREVGDEKRIEVDWRD